MRRYFLVFVLALSPLMAHADTFQYDAWGLFLPSSDCISNCNNLFVHISFQWDGVFATPTTDPMVPGSLHIDTSGFLGTFYGTEHVYTDIDPVRIFNNIGDEIDLEGTFTSMVLYHCASELCKDAYNSDGHILGGNMVQPADYFSINIKPINVPENSSWLMLGVGLPLIWTRSRVAQD